jgi:methylenetetrahydrofolate--tRNA-(uracil-5-)-methyltransferase
VPDVAVIGGGLAGSEAAWQAARLGARVTLYEMRPGRSTEAHKSEHLAELVCSNSLKSDSPTNASGLLKLELSMMGSLLMEIAMKTRVPAGSALCVDRERFSRAVTSEIEASPNILVVRDEVTEVPDSGVAVIAPGPLASQPMTRAISLVVGSPNLFFYDAVSPIIEADSIDMGQVYRASRYDKGGPTYINLPLNQGEYARFVSELRTAEVVARRDFEERGFFSACMPIEELARMGDETLAHGCMKPVGLVDPRTGQIPHAVVQLRPENTEGTLYGMVGFQTRMKQGEQRRILRSLPGLARAVFARYGSIHRNTYINAPRALLPTLEHRTRRNLIFAGQITGAEGYAAAVATGLLAGINSARKAKGMHCLMPPPETMIGGLVRYVAGGGKPDFQPMNPNFGLLPGLGGRVRGRLRRNRLFSDRAVAALLDWMEGAGMEADLRGALEQSGSLS